MRVAFIAALVLGWAYFGLQKRPFDLLTLAYASASVYFLPGVLGFVYLPVEADGRWIETSLVPAAYVVYCLVLGSLTAAAWLKDRRLREPGPTAPILKVRSLWVLWVVLGLAWIGMTVTAVQLGSRVNLPKAELLQSLTRWYSLGSEGAIMATLLAFLLRRRVEFVLAALLLAGDMYLGFRISLAIAVLGLFLIWLGRKPEQRLWLDHYRALLAWLPLAYGLFFFKQISVLIKLRAWESLGQNLADPDLYLFALTRSEPFWTQASLNETLRTSFLVGPGHLFQAAGSVLPFYPVLFGQPLSFNELFQARLFPGVEFGMAANIWAQMWSSGGWLLLVIFALVYAGLLTWGASLLERQRSPVLQAFWTHFWVYAAFYTHRNDLAYQLYLQRRVFLYWFLAILATMLLQAALRPQDAQP